MSPEQAEGKSADERSDVFSFGVVFYEMLAGRRPFTGGSAAAILGAVVHKEPEPLEVSPALAAIVRKCLAKSPDARFQSATELRQAFGSRFHPSPFSDRPAHAGGYRRPAPRRRFGTILVPQNASLRG